MEKSVTMMDIDNSSINEGLEQWNATLSNFIRARLKSK